MKGTLGKIAAIVVVMLAIAPLARGEEQTRESYAAQLEPICKANREANRRIMAGAQERVNKDRLEPAGEQFIRLSDSFGRLIERLAVVPPPLADSHRVDRWFDLMQLLKRRLRNVGKYFKDGLKIKAVHESILAERSGLSANNISIVFHFRHCRFSRIGK